MHEKTKAHFFVYLFVAISAVYAQPLPCFDLLAHRFEVPLHSFDTNRDAVNERERLRMLGEHGRKHTVTMWQSHPPHIIRN